MMISLTNNDANGSKKEADLSFTIIPASNAMGRIGENPDHSILVEKYNLENTVKTTSKKVNRESL